MLLIIGIVGIATGLLEDRRSGCGPAGTAPHHRSALAGQPAQQPAAALRRAAVTLGHPSLALKAGIVVAPTGVVATAGIVVAPTGIVIAPTGIVIATAGIVIAPDTLAGHRSLVSRPALTHSGLARRRAVVIAVAGERRRRAVVRLTTIAPHLVAVVRHGLASAALVTIVRHGLPAATLVAVPRRALVAGALTLRDAGGVRVLAVLAELSSGLMELGLSAGALGILAGGARGVLGAARLGVGDLGAGLAAPALLALLLGQFLAAALFAPLSGLTSAGGYRDEQ